MTSDASPVSSPSPAGGRAGPFSSTITLGRVAGVPIGINWTWLAAFGLFVWSLAGVEFPAALPGRSNAAYAAMGLVAATLFFGSLILHELGHAVQAAREGVRIEGITLWLFGGVAKIAGDFPSAGAEFRIAVAGPLVTLVLGIAFLTAAAPTAGVVREVLLWLGYINVTLLVFNLIPAMPLDGGRALRAWLWARSGNRTAATHTATRVGSWLAIGMIVLGLADAFAGQYGGIWLALIGWFILEAGRAEDRYITTHDALAGATVGALMTADPITIRPDMSLAAFAQSVRGTARHSAYPVVEDGTVIGLLSLSQLTHQPPSGWEHVSVAECMLTASQVPQFTSQTPVADALDQLAQGAGRGLVLADGKLVGIVSISDIARALVLGRAV
jgi:Zn-dependent protease/CBS domain-containing protein